MNLRQSRPHTCSQKRRRVAGQCLTPYPGTPPRPRRYLPREALCVAAAGLFIFALFQGGSQPAAAGLIVEPWDKLAHFAVYGVITALLWLGVGGRAPCVVIAIVIAIGALDELHQISVPGRTADVVDFLVDAVGASVAATAMGWLEAGKGRAGRVPRATQPT